MLSQSIFHILTFHLYQPPGTLNQLRQENEEELQRILKSYGRIARHAQKYSDVAELHVVFSIPLLQQLSDPTFIKLTRHLEDIPAILESFRAASNIEFIASGYQHAPLPLIPTQDWDAQLRNERHIIEETFGRQPKGYYPPGGMFTGEMIPHLIEAGYQFTLLPRAALLNKDGHPVDPYRAYKLEHDFIAFPIDEGFSHAQEHFVEAPWFADEALNGVHLAPESTSPYIVTTCSDGENGKWFRRRDEENGFFGHFFAPYMEFCETGEYPIRPVNIITYLQQATPEAAQLADNSPISEAHPVVQQLQAVAEHYWEKVKKGENTDAKVRELILQAEGSCFVLDQDPQYQKLAALLETIKTLLIASPQTAPQTPESATDRNRESTAAKTTLSTQPATAKSPSKPVASNVKPAQTKRTASKRATTKTTGKQSAGKKKTTGKSTKTTASKTTKDLAPLPPQNTAKEAATPKTNTGVVKKGKAADKTPADKEKEKSKKVRKQAPKKISK